MLRDVICRFVFLSRTSTKWLFRLAVLTRFNTGKYGESGCCQGCHGSGFSHTGFPRSQACVCFVLLVRVSPTRAVSNGPGEGRARGVIFDK